MVGRHTEEHFSSRRNQRNYLDTGRPIAAVITVRTFRPVFLWGALYSLFLCPLSTADLCFVEIWRAENVVHLFQVGNSALNVDGATGHVAAVIAQSNDEEFEKRLATELMDGTLFISIDNCDRPLGGVLLCQALTQDEIKVRVLGASRNVVVPNLPVGPS